MLCSKGSAAGEWTVSTWHNHFNGWVIPPLPPSWLFAKDLYGMDEGTIRLKCQDAFQAIDIAKKEGKVCVDRTC